MGRASAVLLSSVFLLGCSGMNVKRDYDAAFDFRGLKTYAWQSPAWKEGNEDPAHNSLVDARLHKAVDAALAVKGFKVTATGGADCLVATHYAVQKEAATGGVSTGIGLGMGSGGSFGSLGIGIGSGTQEEERETVTVDVLDPRSGKLLWHGFVEQPLERTSDPKAADADINATVRAILSKFPPKPDRG